MTHKSDVYMLFGIQYKSEIRPPTKLLLRMIRITGGKDYRGAEHGDTLRFISGVVVPSPGDEVAVVIFQSELGLVPDGTEHEWRRLVVEVGGRRRGGDVGLRDLQG